MISSNLILGPDVIVNFEVHAIIERSWRCRCEKTNTLSQRTHDVIITPLLLLNNVVTPFGAIMTLSLRHVAVGLGTKNQTAHRSQRHSNRLSHFFSVPLCGGDTCQIWTWYHPGDIMQVTVGLLFLKNWENNGTEENGSVDSRVFVTCELLDWKYLSYSFANSRFPVSEKLTNGALVTPIQEPPIHWRIYAAPGGMS